MKITVTGRHALALAELHQRVDQRVELYHKRYPALGLPGLYHWADPTHVEAAYRGGRLRIALAHETVAVELELPFFARVYRARIEDFVRQEIAAVTAPG